MKIKRKPDHKIYGIIGLGRFGMALAIDLAENGSEILVMDCEEDPVRILRDYTENAYVMSSIDKKSLYNTGVQNCDVVIVCIGERMDTSILTTLYLKNMGVPRVIAKAASSEHGEILEKLGAEVVYPEYDMAVRLSKRLVPSHVISYMELSEKTDISKLMVPAGFVGKTVHELDVRRNYSVNIIAVENNEEIFTDISPNYTFQQNDAIIVIGDKEKLYIFEETAN